MQPPPPRGAPARDPPAGPAAGEGRPAPAREVPRPRRRFLLALTLAVLSGLALLRLPVWSSDVMASRLESFFGRPVSVGGIEYRLFPLEIEVRDVRVAGAGAHALPFLEVPQLIVVPRLRPLWH